MTPSLAISLSIALTSACWIDQSAIELLSDRIFRKRDNAQKYLQTQMPRVRLIVQLHAANNPDAETRRRCASILASYRRSPLERLHWWIEVMPAEGRWPHVDMVYPHLYSGMAHCVEPSLPDMLGHETRQEFYQWYLQRGIASPGLERTAGTPDFPSYRIGSLFMVADLERAGIEAWQVRALLDDLLRLEKEWYRQAGQVRP